MDDIVHFTQKKINSLTDFDIDPVDLQKTMEDEQSSNDEFDF